ncbi:hypothetical protein CRENBAI_001335 [Crenichthys baileyi]|uniref:Uncharacterized protein n=1 Tax=Crenichthys baileyi TaxID=28760 RepID=A0AAV9QXA1_9TELE
MPAGVSWPRYIRMFGASVLAMFAGAQVVHQYYLPDLESTVWRSPKKAYHPGCCMARVKHGGGSVMVWAAISWHSLGPILVLDWARHCQGLPNHSWGTMCIQWFKHCILKAVPCIRMTMHQYTQHDW